MVDYSREKRVGLLNHSDNEPDTLKANEMKLDANALNLSLDTPIFRIFEYNRFIDLIKAKQNTLVRSMMWEDPFENILLNHTFKTRDGEYVDMSCVRDSWYGQSWTIKEQECDGLWRVYSDNGNKRVVRVKSTVRKIFKPLYNMQSMREWQCFIGKVEYVLDGVIVDLLEQSQPLASDRQNICQAQLLLTKRVEFGYEQEVRLLYYKGLDYNNHENIYNYGLDPNFAFDEVVLDPWLPDRLVKIKQDEIFANGYEGKVTKSKLYANIGIQTQLV